MFVDERSVPLANVRVAMLIGVHDSSHVAAMRFGPRYENLVVARQGVTSGNGSLLVPSGAVVAIVDRERDFVPVIVDGRSIVVPGSFDRATADPRLATALDDRLREPPDEESVKRALRRVPEGGGSIEGVVVFDGCSSAEVVAVSPDAVLDILAVHRIRDERPKRPFVQTSGGSGEREHRFRVSHLAPGRHRLQIAAPHFAPALTTAFTIRNGEHRALEAAIELRRGGIVVVAGTMGGVIVGPRSASTSLRFGGPNGLIDGLGAGTMTIRSWNGGCCVGPDRDVRVPAQGTVVVEFLDGRR